MSEDKQKIKDYGKQCTRNMPENDKQKKKNMHERIQKKSIQQCVKKKEGKQ